MSFLYIYRERNENRKTCNTLIENESEMKMKKMQISNKEITITANWKLGKWWWWWWRGTNIIYVRGK
jgi:hypothetical protein